MTDIFSSTMRSPKDPAATIFAISPNDDVDLAMITTALNVATPGVIRLTMADGSTGEISIAPGQAFPVRARRIWRTGTTAAGIYGLV